MKEYLTDYNLTLSPDGDSASDEPLSRERELVERVPQIRPNPDMAKFMIKHADQKITETPIDVWDTPLPSGQAFLPDNFHKSR